MDYLILIFGFVLLILSGDFLVSSSSRLAVRFNIPKMIIGLIIVSFGTSAPELLVSLQAAFNGHPEMAMGNIIGSNIANIALVLGLTAMVYPIVVKSKTILFDWSVMFAASCLLWGLSYDNKLTWYEGVLFIALLATYIFYSIKYRPNTQSAEECAEESEEAMPLWKALLMLLASVLGLYFGSKLLVDSASHIASAWGVSERLISVSVIAFGTSVPELATSLIAAFKKEMEISIGNIIGSNIFNILSILGITASVRTIEFEHSLVINDMPWVLGVALALLLAILPIKKGVINRWKGFLLLLIYLLYIGLQFGLN